MQTRLDFALAAILLFHISSLCSFASLTDFEVTPDNYSTTQSALLIASGSEGNPAGVGVNDNCVDEWILVTDANDGELLLSSVDGTFTFDPNPNFIGTTSFSYSGVLLNAEIVPANAIWNYLNPDGDDPRIADPDFNQTWHTLAYDDSSWLQGSGSMGRGSFGGQSQPDTIISETRVPTYYFRHRFVVPDGNYQLFLNLIRDDGAIIYVDGQELARSHPPGATAFATAADTYDLTVNSRADENTIFREELSTLALAKGEHQLAISLHNESNFSSDHGIRIESLVAGKIESPPRVVTISVADGAVPPILTDDYFVVSTEGVLEACVLDNDRLFDPSGTAYDPILEVLVNSSPSPDGELTIDPLTGQFSFDPAPGFTGLTEATYQVRDKDGLSEAGSISISVTPPDTGAISLAEDAFTLAQGETFQTGAGIGRSVLLNDLRVSRVSLIESASFGSVELAETGEFSYTPNPNFIGTDSFTYSALVMSGEADWKYLHPHYGTDPAIADLDFNSTWATPGFDDAGWSDGSGLMGYGTIGIRDPDTDIGIPPPLIDGTQVRKTAYFRTTFDSGVSEFSGLNINLVRDDAAIIYLNGIEIGRSHPATTQPFAEEPDVYDLLFPRSSSAGPLTEDIPVLEYYGAAQVLNGTNVLAISLHNGGSSSSDLGLEVLSVSSGASALVSLEVEDSQSVPSLRPDQMFAAQGDSAAGNLYANDGLFDPDGIAYNPILDLEVSGQLSPFITSLSRETGDFQIELPADLIGTAEFFYRVADKDGWSELTAVTVHIEADAVANPFVRIAPLGSSIAASLGTPVEIAGSDSIQVTLPQLPVGLFSVALRSPLPESTTMTLSDASGLEVTSVVTPVGGAQLLQFETILPERGRYKLVIENQSPNPLGASLDLYSNAHVSREQGASMGSAIDLDPIFYPVSGGGAETANLIVETDLSKFGGAVVFEEDFETGTLADEWDFYAAFTGTGKVSSARGAADGTVFALVLEGSDDKRVTRSIDLSGVANPILRFAHASWDRRVTTVADRGTRAVKDGVVISVDGEEWFTVFTPPEHGENAGWSSYEIDLKKIAAREGFSTDGVVQLRLGHVGDSDEARAFDEITITERPLDTRWHQLLLNDGETLSARIASLEPWTGTMLLEMLDPLGNVIGSAPAGAETRFAFTDTSNDGMPGEYFLRVTSAHAAYSLALVKGAQVSTPGSGEAARKHRGVSRGFLSNPGEDSVVMVIENSFNSDETATAIRSAGSDCVISVGNHRYFSNSELADWETYLDTEFGQFILGRIDAKFPTQTSPTQRFFPVVGESDVDPSDSILGGSLAGYLDFFHANPGGIGRLPQGGGAVHSSAESYYQFHCGPAHFFVIDSHHALANPESLRLQRRWLQSELARSDASWKFVVSRAVPYSNIGTLVAPEIRWEGEWLGATAVIGGSSRLFEHIQSGGIDYFATSLYTTGGGLAPARVPGTQGVYDSTILRNGTREQCLLKLTLNDSGVRVEFVSTGGFQIYQKEIGTPGLDRPSETFHVDLVAGNPIALAASIPETVERLTNTLELSIEVRDPDGNLVAFGEGSEATALILPTTTGVYQVEVSTSSGAGEYFLMSSQPTAWQEWQLANFGQSPVTGTSGDLDDPDSDGRMNIIEYAFLTDPNVPDSGDPSMMASGSYTGTGRSALLRLPEQARDDIALSLEISDDLGASGWTTISTRTGTGAWIGVQPTIVGDQFGAAFLNFELPGRGRIFARLSVSRIVR